MTKIDLIKNTRYIKALSEEDLKKLMASMSQWPEKNQNEFIEGILKMEASADTKIVEVINDMENSVQSAVELMKKGERESRELDEKEDQDESFTKAEAALGQL